MKTYLPALLLFAVAAGCSGKDADSGAAADEGCGLTIDTTYPENNATDFYYRGAIEFYLSDADPTATASVEGVDGTSSLNEDEDVVTFTPSSPLAPSTTYTATLASCNSEDASITFTTSELGGAVDPSGLVGNSYALDLKTGRIVIPEGVGTVLEAYLDYTIFLGVTSADSSSLQIMGAVASEDDPTMQDYCTPTLDFPEANFAEAPYFQIGPETTTLSVAGYSITIDDLLVSGDFAPSGEWVGGATLAGSIDTRPLVSLLDDDPEADDNTVCELVAGFGVDCITCSDGQPYCLELLVDSLVAEQQTGLTLDYIEYEDCHEQCPDLGNNPECPLNP